MFSLIGLGVTWVVDRWMQRHCRKRGGHDWTRLESGWLKCAECGTSDTPVEDITHP